ncbi:hypothetical protein FKW77_008733 [Venturia effusa]|uniref:Uncharacterized protein n=1 Tax=Venturia effusa TaxID=50376 RepID=A0A517LEE2_9PEZI|nr:hypothetical protein FKW77_008733 [Venturia effusa]
MPKIATQYNEAFALKTECSMHYKTSSVARNTPHADRRLPKGAPQINNGPKARLDVERALSPSKMPDSMGRENGL